MNPVPATDRTDHEVARLQRDVAADSGHRAQALLPRTRGGGRTRTCPVNTNLFWSKITSGAGSHSGNVAGGVARGSSFCPTISGRSALKVVAFFFVRPTISEDPVQPPNQDFDGPVRGDLMVLEDPRRKGRGLRLGDHGVRDDAADQTDQLVYARIYPALEVPRKGQGLPRGQTALSFRTYCTDLAQCGHEMKSLLVVFTILPPTLAGPFLFRFAKGGNIGEASNSTTRAT